MIYFITPRKDHDPFLYKSQKITIVSDFACFDTLMKESVLDFDSEFNGKRFFLNELLLIQIGTKDLKVVIDFTELPEHAGWRQRVIEHFNASIRPDHIFLGHNLKADYNACKPYGFKFPLFFDTMIAEQRINLGKGLLNNYKDTYERRLKKFFPEDKEIRDDFVHMNKTSKFAIKHITYAAGDVGDTKSIAEIQKAILASTKQAWFVRNVEFPLVKILGDIELKGLYLDEAKWDTLIETKKKRKFQCTKEMDAEIVALGKGNIKLLGGKYNLNRKGASVIQPDLFGGKPTVTENKNVHNINYNSTDQVMDVIVRLGLPKPTFAIMNSETHKKEERDSLREEAIQSYLMEHPTTPIKSFLEKLIEYKGLQKFVSSYGLKFLNYVVKKDSKYELGFKNPVTNRVHTVLKQCFTDTGRLSSGDKSEGLFNIQNLPAEPEIRECFSLSPQEISEGYFFSTIDLSGAELTIMAALADDQTLYNLGADKIIDGKKVEGDMHSPTATKCWRAVYQYRKSKLIASLKKDEDTRSDEEIFNSATNKDSVFTIQDSKGKKYVLTEDFVISKQNNKQLRTDFKPMIFGCVYGLMAKKGGETLNIPKDEAQVVIDVIKREFPKTFKMVEAHANFALRHGYVIFNNRSNNRRYFQPVLDILATIDQNKYTDQVIINYVKEKLDFTTYTDIEKEARNAPIQGTQADMIKESLVEIYNHPKYKESKASLLLSVHDENGCMHIGKEFGPIMKQIMMDVANKYLEPYSKNIRMGADLALHKETHEPLTHWTK